LQNWQEVKVQKKVSIIVPVYNVEKFIKRCLNSLINQSLKDIEIICINDGSTDKSLQILEEFAQKDDRVIIINQDNSGVSVARNNGIDNASGEFIGFVDSDDWVDLDFYEKLYNTAKSHDADIAVGGIIRLHKYHKKYHLKLEKEISTSDTNQKFILCDVPEKSYTWNKIYNREKILELNLRFEEGRIFEDVIFTPQALYHMGNLVTVPNTYYYYWRRFNSTVAQRDKKACIDSVYAHQKAQEFFKEKNIDISKQEIVTKRYKVFGITLFKTQKHNNHTKYIFFNIFKIKI
jgi:glycosyltransferase involved in cell wall biosynthesis